MHVELLEDQRLLSIAAFGDDDALAAAVQNSSAAFVADDPNAMVAEPQSKAGAPEFAAGEILIGFEGDLPALYRSKGATAALEAAGKLVEAEGLHSAKVLMDVPAGAGHAARLATVWQLPAGADVLQTVQRLAGRPGIAYAEPNYTLSIATEEVFQVANRLGPDFLRCRLHVDAASHGLVQETADCGRCPPRYQPDRGQLVEHHGVEFCQPPAHFIVGSMSREARRGQRFDLGLDRFRLLLGNPAEGKRSPGAVRAVELDTPPAVRFQNGCHASPAFLRSGIVPHDPQPRYPPNLSRALGERNLSPLASRESVASLMPVARAIWYLVWPHRVTSAGLQLFAAWKASPAPRFCSGFSGW